MTRKTLKALNGSIDKWQKIVDGKGVDMGVDNCPLCALFFDSNDCEGCPIPEKNELAYWCEDTPFIDWVVHHNEVHDAGKEISYSNKVECKECSILAKKELKFLKSLLPKTKVKK